MLSVGSLAPQFEALDQAGAQTSLDQLLQRGRLVLYFYPRDFTRVCSAQACLFRDAEQELAAQGVNVAGVSPDPSASHARFSDRHSLGFTLLADPDQRIARAYDARRSLLGLTKRITYVIATDRRIQAAIHHELSAEKHLIDVRAALAATP